MINSFVAFVQRTLQDAGGDCQVKELDILDTKYLVSEMFKYLDPGDAGPSW